jgi:hypothetical protein
VRCFYIVLIYAGYISLREERPLNISPSPLSLCVLNLWFELKNINLILRSFTNDRMTCSKLQVDLVLPPFFEKYRRFCGQHQKPYPHITLPTHWKPWAFRKYCGILRQATEYTWVFLGSTLSSTLNSFSSKNTTFLRSGLPCRLRSLLLIPEVAGLKSIISLFEVFLFFNASTISRI